MAGPWEKYQQPEADSSGPWSKYQTPVANKPTLAETMQAIGNTTSPISDVLKSAGAGALDAAAQGVYGVAHMIPGVGKYITPPETVENMPYSPFGGIPDNTATQLAKVAGGVAPYLAGGEALAGGKYGNMLGQTIFGALQNPQHPLAGAAIGGGSSAVLDALHSGANVVADKLSGVLNKNTINPLVNKIKNYIGNNEVNLQGVANKIKGNFDALGKQENSAWKSATDSAKSLDKAGVPFSAENYKNSIVSNADKLSGRSTSQTGFVDPDVAEANKEALEYLGTAGEDDHIPQGWEDLVLRRKGINNAIKNSAAKSTTPGFANPVVTSTVGSLKESLLQDAEDNAAANPEAQDFLDKWQNANKISQSKNAFANAPNPTTNNVEFSKNVRDSIAGNDISPKLFASYAPKKAANPTGLDQLTQNLGGDKGTARKALLTSMVGGKTPASMITELSNMSQNTRSALLDGDTQQNLKQLLDAKSVDAFLKHGKDYSHFSLRNSLPHALGLLGGGGYGFHVGGIPGALAGMAIGAGAPMLAAPTSKILPTVTGAARRIAPPLLSTYLTPQGGNNAQ